MMINAIYENGVFRPTEPVDLPERTPVTVEAPGVTGTTAKRPLRARDLVRFQGTLKSFPEDPVQWQRRMRDEEWS
jgi:predicted DNA-binding antitoxin AbrB/MazE fold protein